MSVTAELADGRVLEFPDGTDPAVVQTTVKKLLGVPSEFGSTPGGAATGVRRPSRLLSPAGEAGASILGAGGVGAVMGAAAPEILSGVAQAVRPFPLLSGMAPALETASRVARAAGRPSGAVAGAVGGLASETTGQALEAGGAPQWLAEGGRFAAGGLTPVAAASAMKIVDLYKQTPSLGLFAKGKKELIKSIAAKLQGRPQDINAEEAAHLNMLVGELRGGPASNEPARGVYGLMEAGAKTRLAVGETEAKKIMENANFSISKELADATKKGAYTTEAERRIAMRGEDALTAAKLQRLNVGEDLPASETGGRIRSTVMPRHQAALEARNAQDETLRKARNELVGQLESSGNRIDAMPEYQALVSSLEAELRPGKHSKEVAGNFRHILEQITTKAKTVEEPFGGMGGMGGDPFAAAATEKPPVSFQQIDDARRKLGDVFRGQPAEGYAALDAATRREYYGKLATLQEKFAGGEGGAHAQLQRAYADNTEGLQVFGSKVAKRVTAVDRNYESLFQTDAASLPPKFFNTRQGVADLIELTGDRAFAVKAAKDFSTTELNGLNESQVRDWMTKRREMLAALPEVRDAVTKYANHLQYGEMTERAAQGGVEKLTAYRTAQEKMAGQRGAAIGSEAKGLASFITKQRGEEAISLLGPRGQAYPVQNVNALIDNGSTDAWAVAAPHILASPGGAAMLEDAIRQRLAQKAFLSIKELEAFFNDNARPGITATRLMSESKAEQISVQLRAIENMKLPEPEKLSMGRRMVIQGFAGVAAGADARGATGLAALIPGPNAEQDQRPAAVPQRRQPHGLSDFLVP